MNNYIQLNAKKYYTLGADWTPTGTVPTQIRPTWTGRLDVTYAPSSIKSYAGTIIVRQSPETGFGNLANFKSVYLTAQPFTFVDHYGVSFLAVFMGVMSEKSFLNTWDSTQNEYRIPVTMYIVAAL